MAGAAVELAPDLNLLGQVHALVERFEAAVAAQVGREAGDLALIAFHTAVVEIATNIMRHAYPATWPARPFRLQLQLYADRVEAHFEDTGIPFTLPDAPALPADDDPLALPEGGFGLFLVRQSVDDLSYTRSDQGVNHWRLVKRFAA